MGDPTEDSWSATARMTALSRTPVAEEARQGARAYDSQDAVESPWLAVQYTGLLFGHRETLELSIHGAPTLEGGAAAIVIPTLFPSSSVVVAPAAPLCALMAMRTAVLTWFHLLGLGFREGGASATAGVRTRSWQDEALKVELSTSDQETRVTLSTPQRTTVDIDPDPLDAMNRVLRGRRVRAVLRESIGSLPGGDPGWSGLASLSRFVEPAERVPAPRGLTFAWPAPRDGGWVGAITGAPAGVRGLVRLDGSGPIDLLVAYALLAHSFEMDPVRPRLRSRGPVDVAPRAVSQRVRVGPLAVTLWMEWPHRSERGGGAQWECRVGADGYGSRAVVTHGHYQWDCLELACLLVHRSIHAGSLAPLGLTDALP